MDWSARSPDLNPIEHMWNELQVRLSARQIQPRSLQVGVGPRMEQYSTKKHQEPYREHEEAIWSCYEQQRVTYPILILYNLTIFFFSKFTKFHIQSVFVFIFKGHPTKLLKSHREQKNPLKTVDIIK